MSVVMRLWGTAAGQPTAWDNQFLKDFDLEAHGGIGMITMTPNAADAKQFATAAEALTFYRQSPKCRPIRPDGKPNRPLTATNWSFEEA